MNIWKYMKSNKVFFLLSLAAAVLGTLASFLMGGCTKKSEDQNRVLASKRVKVDIKEPALPAGLAARKKKTVKAEAAKPVEQAPAPVTAKEPERPAPRPRVAEKPAPAPAPAKRVAKAPAPRPAATARPVKKAPRATARKTARPWAVNVASFTHGKDAEKLRKLLISIGYNAYMTKFVKDGTLFYRIRVGFYPTRDEAAAVGRKIAARYRYVGTPWVVKPGRREVASHIR